MAFFQTPPSLGNQLSEDRVLRSYLARHLKSDVLADIRASLEEMGELSGDSLYRLQLADRLNEPKLVQWDAWGNRIDEIEVSPLWRECQRIAAESGLVAIPHERRHGSASRVHQFSLVYLFSPSSDVYTCPLAMTDGATATLGFHGGPTAEKAIPHLTSRDPKTAWTSGQWMTERTGGSDVGLSETVARRAEDGSYRLHGTKWFTSATTSQMALTLGRPEGNPSGSKGLALFYVEVRDAAGRMNGIAINRLKDKLGTRKVPTAELTLDGAVAHPVAGLTDGIRNITPMLNVTRTWNSVCAISGMRRAIALARNYAKKRVQFGAPLAEKPLHIDTLAKMQAEFEGAFHLVFRVVELIGRIESGEATETETDLVRLLTPVMKLTTGKQAVALASEALECFGGAGYVEDTGLPMLLRDAQVLSIWEGTTNVLSLDTLRALARETRIEVLSEEIARATNDCLPELAREVEVARNAVAHATRWLVETASSRQELVEAGARRFALTLGRATELALLISHATWAKQHERDERPMLAAKHFARTPVDLIDDHEPIASAALANDT